MTTAPATTSTHLLYVVSSIYKEGSDGDNQGGNWFWLLPGTTLEAATAAYRAEAQAMTGMNSRIVLVQVEVPADLTGEDVTEFVDAMLWDIETGGLVPLERTIHQDPINPHGFYESTGEVA